MAGGRTAQGMTLNGKIYGRTAVGRGKFHTASTGFLKQRKESELPLMGEASLVLPPCRGSIGVLLMVEASLALPPS